MCEAAPGPRCASDTRSVSERSGRLYRVVYPKGPAINPLDAATASGQGWVSPTLADARPTSSSHAVPERVMAARTAAYAAEQAFADPRAYSRV
jgi:hypothetical protein